MAGFTTALAGFDLDAPLTSLMALGMAALQAAGSFTLLAPGLGKTIMGAKGMEGVLTSLKKPFKDLVNPFKDAGKAAKGAFNLSRFGSPAGAMQSPGGMMGRKAAKSTFTGKGIKQSLSTGSKAFFGTMKNKWLGIVKGSFSGLPGLLASLIVGPLVGAVGNAIANWQFGKTEQITGTNIEGRTGKSGAEGLLLEHWNL